jgi:protein-S-isoprenylcysteine O-methyltransferase Ste14
MTPTPPDHAGVFIPPPLLYAVPLGVGALLQRLVPIAILPRSVETVAGGWLLFALGIALFAAALLNFHRARTSLIPVKPTTAIVESGPYRLTRNPMYVSMTLVYLGVTLWIDSAWPLVFLPIILFTVQRAVIAREERYLEAKFGEAYRGYKARVRRWI